MRVLSHRFQRRNLALFSGLLILLCINLIGCIGATPMRRRTRSARGVEQNFTLNSIETGQTSRAQIESTLGSFDVGLRSTHFLIARYSVSTWGAWAFGCGNYNCAGAAGRLWGRHNVIVEFDNDERVKSLQDFSDSELVAKLARVAQVDDPLDLSTPVQMHVTYLRHGPATITLTADSFQFVEDGKTKKPYNFTIARTQVTGVGTSRIGLADETYVTEVIHFERAPHVEHRHSSNRLTVQMTIPDLLRLLKFLSTSHDSPAHPE